MIGGTCAGALIRTRLSLLVCPASITTEDFPTPNCLASQALQNLGDQRFDRRDQQHLQQHQTEHDHHG